MRAMFRDNQRLWFGEVEHLPRGMTRGRRPGQSAAAFLSYPFFQRISGLLQLLAFFVILALFLLTPPLATPAGLSSPANQRLLAWLPSFWFLGLFHELSGTADPVFAPLAVRSLWSLAAVCLFSFAAAAFTYRRTARRVVELAGGAA